LLELTFKVSAVGSVADGALPQIRIGLEIESSPGDEPVQSIVLCTQVRIDCAQRAYSPQEQERLRELFGEPSLWWSSLRSVAWVRTITQVGAFRGRTQADLIVPCSHDLEVVATKYFFGLRGGHVPLRLLFSGSAFHGTEGALQVTPIPWTHELAFELPERVWREVMQRHYDERMLLGVRRDVFERLYRYRREHGLPAWEQVFQRLLDQARAPEESS
jgi:hypothetical protein